MNQQDFVESSMSEAMRIECLNSRLVMCKRREFTEAIQPIIKAIVKIREISLPTIRVYEHKVETEYNFTDEQKEVLDWLQHEIELVAKRIFGA